MCSRERRSGVGCSPLRDRWATRDGARADPKTKEKIQMMRRVRIALVATSLFLSLGVIPASAAEGGSPGPCVAGTPLEGVRLGWDVGFVARDGGTPLPSNFAFEGGDPMPPGRLMGYAREAGLC